MFIGRQKELKLLEEKYQSKRSEIIVITGRRRIGKSALIDHFIHNKNSLRFEAIEGKNTPEQITHFVSQLKNQMKDPLLEGVQFQTWHAVFTYLTQKIQNQSKKTILFFDELQWMAAEKSSLISLIKFFWDNHWKKKNILLILCGSIASFMLERVIKSKALYGRITGEIHLKSLSPPEAKAFFRGKRSPNEVLLYLLVFGGIPKYLELVDENKSFHQNMNSLCFKPEGVMLTEFDKIFYSHFKTHRVYLKIVKALRDKAMSLNEISKVLKMPSGGGLKRYLTQLEDAEMIKGFVSLTKELNTKFKKYRLDDEYLVFYFKYLEPFLRIIRESPVEDLFEMITQKSFDSWMGFAFERFCLKQAAYLSKIMGFSNKVLSFGPFFTKESPYFQIDLLYTRTDKVITLCEVKFHQKEIDTTIIPEVERKCQLFPLPKGYTLEKALISLHGPSKALLDTEYFHHYVSMKDIMG